MSIAVTRVTDVTGDPLSRRHLHNRIVYAGGERSGALRILPKLMRKIDLSRNSQKPVTCVTPVTFGHRSAEGR